MIILHFSFSFHHPYKKEAMESFSKMNVLLVLKVLFLNIFPYTKNELLNSFVMEVPII